VRYESRQAFNNHYYSKHTNKFCCDTCTKTFPNANALNTHKSTHTNERAFPCPKPAKTRHGLLRKSCLVGFKTFAAFQHHLQSKDHRKDTNLRLIVFYLFLARSSLMLTRTLLACVCACVCVCRPVNSWRRLLQRTSPRLRKC